MHFERMGVHVNLPNQKTPIQVNLTDEYLAPKRITKADLNRWIDQAEISDETKAALIKILEAAPANTMHHFYKNIHEYIARIQETLRQQETNDYTNLR